jgi:outer membrane protein assembly factor BamB
LAGSVYAADNRGTIFRVALERKVSDTVDPLTPENWKIRAVATLHPDPKSTNNTAKDSYAVPYGVQLGIIGDYIWLTGGTTDLRGRTDSANPTGVLQNKSQMIFAFRTGRFQTELYKADDLKALNAEDSGTLDPSDLNGGRKGWKINLRSPAAPWSSEYVSTRALVANGVLYISTFREEQVAWTSTQLCVETNHGRIDGESRIYALDLATGRSIWPIGGGGKYATLRHAKVTGITRSVEGTRNRVFFTYDKLTDGALDFSAFSGIQGYMSSTNADAPFIAVDEYSTSGSSNLPEGANMVQYWLKN